MSAAPYAHRLVVALICPAACTLWLYALRYLKPGLSRQLAALPVLICNTLVPLLFNPRHEWVSCFLAEFQLTWLCNWKVSQPSKSVGQPFQSNVHRRQRNWQAHSGPRTSV